MKYAMEELVPIAGELAGRYTAGEGTSVTWEKAEQFMEAVLYCIHEAELFTCNAVAAAEELPAQRAYEIGKRCVEEKVQEALKIYNEILPEFSCYENHCLYDTFVKGIPEFFRWYDVRFAPQNTVLTLDYPVLRDLSEYNGIDKIYEFIRCICLEQKFLNIFPEYHVVNILSRYNREYKDMVENICEIVCLSATGHILAGKPFTELNLEKEDYLRIQEIFVRMDFRDIMKKVKGALELFLIRYCDGSEEPAEYIFSSVSGIVRRLKCAAESGTICRLF